MEDEENAPPRKKYRSQTIVLDEEEATLAQSLPNIPTQREDSPSVEYDQDEEEVMLGGRGGNDSDAGDADVDHDEEHDEEHEDDSMEGPLVDNGVCFPQVFHVNY